MDALFRLMLSAMVTAMARMPFQERENFSICLQTDQLSSEDELEIEAKFAPQQERCSLEIAHAWITFKSTTKFQASWLSLA